MTIWTPTLNGQGPLYRQLLDAIRQAISDGSLPVGQRLPTHRALADRLGVTVGTVTRAYSEAEHAGLLQGKVGSGTYVRDQQGDQSQAWQLRQPNPGRIELWQNLPVALDREAMFRRALESMMQTPGLVNGLMEYDCAEGRRDQRERLAAWLESHGMSADPERILLTYGAQNGLLLSLLMLGVTGEGVLCEGLTYPGISNLAHSLRLQLQGLAMDDEGLLPEALEKACQSGHYRVLYLIPTLQNPTTATMSLARRQAILQICERYHLWVIEDEVHALLPEVRPVTLHSLAPDRVIHIGSLAKGVSAGLRIGYLLVPEKLKAAAAQAVRGASWMVSPLLGEIVCRWLVSGDADRLLEQQRQMLAERGRLLQHHLGHHALRYAEGSMHAWLELPAHWRSAAFVAAAEAQGIGLASAELFAAGHYPAPQAVRLSISHPLDNAALEQALITLAGLLDSKGSANECL